MLSASVVIAAPIATTFAPVASTPAPMATALTPEAETVCSASPVEIAMDVAAAEAPGPIARLASSDVPPKSAKPVLPSPTHDPNCNAPPLVPATLLSLPQVSVVEVLSSVIFAASIFTSVISISPPATSSALPSAVPPPPQRPPQSTLPSNTITVTSPENSSASRLVTCIASIEPSIFRYPSPSSCIEPTGLLVQTPFIEPA